MDTSLAPIHVANHWPFVDRHLSLERWQTGRQALEFVAQLQNEAAGEYVRIGRKRLTESKLTAGQAGAIWRALTELEERGVVARLRGAGRRPDSWSLRPELTHWRGMPWKYSGREVERVLCGCISRASCAVAARTPGQSVALPRVKKEFRIAPQDHLLPLGLFPVDARGFPAGRAATANSRAWGSVDTRGNGAEIVPFDAPPTVLPVVLEELLLTTEGAAGRHERFRQMIDKRAVPGQNVKPGLVPDQKLMRLAIELDDEQATEARIRWVNEHPECQVPSGVDDLVRIAAGLPARRVAL
ncbi:MAG TPA: hypothetical protein VGR90_04530 [Acidimicrobiales bacterium]|nr:hypothetical protein [Acidimicrobiales bacterium]